MTIRQFAKRIDSHQARLEELLHSEGLKYSDWPPPDSEQIRQSSGVYHFFEIRADEIFSLYVGKGGFGKGNDWNLYNRINQHFLPSQKYALLGKASKALAISPEEAKRLFNERNVFLQWLVLGTRAEQQEPCLESQLCWFEHFATAVLCPVFAEAQQGAPTDRQKAALFAVG